MTTTRIILRWSFIPGLISALIIWIINPDTGHISAFDAGVMIGIAEAPFGALAGAIFALLVLRIPFIQRFGRIGFLLLGAVVGAIVGGIAWITVFHTLWTMVVAVLLGAVLGLFYKGWRSAPEAAGGPTT
jgi:Na+/melibiose symporter-like transporter